MEKELLDDANARMAKGVEATRTEFNTVRSGRASTGLLDRVHVDYYGTSTPLKQLASIAAPEPRLSDDNALRQRLDPRRGEGHPRVRPGAQPEQRRHDHPSAGAHPDRGAPARAS